MLDVIQNEWDTVVSWRIHILLNKTSKFIRSEILVSLYNFWYPAPVERDIYRMCTSTCTVHTYVHFNVTPRKEIVRK